MLGQRSLKIRLAPLLGLPGLLRVLGLMFGLKLFLAAHVSATSLSSLNTDESNAVDDTYRESGTKFMLDQCAAGYVRARLHGRDVMMRMEAYADRTFDQRMLIYGHSSIDRNNAEFYLATVRHLESDVELMAGISLAVEKYQSLGVWTTPQHQRHLNILLEFQRHLLPGERGGAQATSFTSDTVSAGGSMTDRRSQRRSRQHHNRRRYLLEGRIPQLDQFVAEYMQARATALTLWRQARTLVGLMSDGLPKRWASLYLEVMEAVEEQGGLKQILVIGEEWSWEAQRLTEDLTRQEYASGQRRYLYGGKDDPDGRMLVFSAFQSVPEWVRVVEEHDVSANPQLDSRDVILDDHSDRASGSNSGRAFNDRNIGAVKPVKHDRIGVGDRVDYDISLKRGERGQGQNARRRIDNGDSPPWGSPKTSASFIPSARTGQADNLSLLDMWHAIMDVGADSTFYLTQVRIPRKLYILANAVLGGLIGATTVICGRKARNLLCPHHRRKKNYRRHH